MIADPIVAPLGEEGLHSESLVRLHIAICHLTIGARFPRSRWNAQPWGCHLKHLSSAHSRMATRSPRRCLKSGCGCCSRYPTAYCGLRAGPAMMEENLRQAARMRGVSTDRLIFAPFVASMDDHLARLQCADVFLDTLPYNAHSTAIEALWAGLPVISCRGRSFAGRVGASALAAAGLTELVADDLAHYFRLARDLACTQTARAALCERLVLNRNRAPLFDTERYARDLETVLLQMAACADAT